LNEQGRGKILEEGEVEGGFLNCLLFTVNCSLYFQDRFTGIWGKEYFVSTVGINENIIHKYVEMQGKEESGQAQLELF